MKPTPKPSAAFPCAALSRRSRSAVLLCVLTTLCRTATGADVPLLAGDALGFSSFNSNGINPAVTPSGWTGALAPAAGNRYLVAVEQLRTPADANGYVFAGDTLVLNPGGGLSYKGTGTTGVQTIADLQLAGGTLRHLNSSADIFAIAGHITVSGTGSVIRARQGPINVQSVVSGTGDLKIDAADNAYYTTFSAANTYTGNLTVATGAYLSLAAGSGYTFVKGGSGEFNSITGTGTALFDGAFNIDLTGVAAGGGEAYTLVDATTLAETFGANFQVTGWTETNGIWVSPTGDFQFSEATGVLASVEPDTDQDGLPDWWELENFRSSPGESTAAILAKQTGADDPDGDFCSNLEEYLAFTDPNDVASFPDSDSDGLPDGWEKTYFGDLTPTADGDPDGDRATNAVEYAAHTLPNDRSSFPDQDGDQISDAWEIAYFGSIEACVPGADPDGDLFDNLTEFTAATDPTQTFSSPDTDGDGLPDGWEVKYFRQGAEDLAAAIARQDGAGDPDSDTFTNAVELANGSDPTSGSSVPSAVAYWRFEERTAGVVPVGDNLGGTAPNTVLDSSGKGNHMMTWRDYTSPVYTPATPYGTVPGTGVDNTAALNFVRDGGNLYVTDNIYTTAGDPINSQVFQAFTIEASFNTPNTGLWQVVIGKSGNPIGGQPPFTLKIRAADNLLIAGIVDGAGAAQEAVSTRAIATGTWYSAAVTASATELKLWLKSATDTAYVLEATTPISGAFYDYAGVDAPWVIGLGKWNGADADPFNGRIDEVRITPSVLAATRFLGVPPGTGAAGDLDGDGMDDSWEESYFHNLDQTAAGDYDGDGTSNLAEFRLGLDPTKSSSRFAASVSGALVQWPAASGLSFTVQRSTSLEAGSWSDVATVIAAGSTASWTDPAPPAGKAFYRVVLAE